MRTPARLLALAASGLSCAGVEPAWVPVCVEAELHPLPEARCEFDADVVDYTRDTVLTLWGYVGSQASRLPIVVELDARSRIESVCVEEGASIGWGIRDPLERAIRTLRAMPPGPECLAGRRLELGEAFADSRPRSRPNTWRSLRVEETCAPGQQSCEGWREPVCALLSDGRRKTYPDACEACRDPAVRGYDEEACPFP